jgi:predicted HTH transcriptional regulator
LAKSQQSNEIFPFSKTVVITEHERIALRKSVIESVRECIGESSILRSRLPQVPADVLKELVVNAYIHRCYRTPAPILINVSDEGLEVRSPGELLTGLSVSNLIHGLPVYRNLLLADGARFVGLCDKIGQGIDLIFQGALSCGLGFPEFESGGNVFIARIPLAGSAEFKEFMRKRSWSLNQLDEIIVLRILWGRRPRVSTTFVSGCSANGNLLLACWSRCAGKAWSSQSTAITAWKR